MQQLATQPPRQLTRSVNPPEPTRRAPGPLRVDRSLRGFRVAVWIFSAVSLLVLVLAAIAV